MPGPYPREFREDVVAGARRRASGVTLKQIATDFGISEATLQKRLRQADVEEGNRPRPDGCGRSGAARVEEADPVARAGERGPAPCGGVSVEGESEIRCLPK